MKFRLLAFILTISLLIGCTNLEKQKEHFDYFESFNRSMYNLNFNILDPYLIRPIAIKWRDYIPKFIRNGIIGVSNNLEEPAIMMNFLLQGNPYQGAVHFTRFFLNTLLGLGGFIDIASFSHEKLQREQPKRFGSTLGYYGFGYGPYIYFPLYGSFTFRDDIGNIFDTFYPALSWISFPFLIGKWILEGIEVRAQFLDSDKLLRQSSDPYAIVREVYFQNHNFIVNNENSNLKNQKNIKLFESNLIEIDTD